MRNPCWQELHEDLRALHGAALAAADPSAAVRRALGGDPFVAKDGWVGEGGRILLVAVGKASVGMARAACEVLGERVAAGVVVHPDGGPGAGRKAWPPGVVALGAGHPLPDEGSLAAGEGVARLLAGARESDRVLVLLSGGASALLERLRPGVSLAELRALTLALQRAGCDIESLNTVRRALSTLKGGGLARLAAPARVVTLALSDVVGDAPEAIGSGPTVPSPTGATEALAVLERAGVVSQVPRVAAVLREAVKGLGEAPPLVAAAAPGGRPLRVAAGEGRPARGPEGRPARGPAATGWGEYWIVGSNRMAAEAVAAEAARCGFDARVVSTELCGEARAAGAALARAALDARATRPLCLVWGGETTVTVRGPGRGGRNQELALGATRVLAGHGRIAILSFATDGVDGPTEAAGALATGDTLARAATLGLSADQALAANDSEPFFRALGDLWITGPTGTNVNDLAVALVFPTGETEPS
ncbi:MAG TPA: DUF4147 domain-containing protein [Thermoanaerobaculia bacterium]|nr:DUF4147 domain-containing protein [Thermoanaerobaculia bacterium]